MSFVAVDRVKTCVCGCGGQFDADFRNTYQQFVPSHMVFVLTATQCWVQADVNDKKWLKTILSVDIPGAKYSKMFHGGQWDGKHKFYNWTNSKFGIGLVPYVLSKAAGRRIVIKDHRAFPKIDTTIPKLKGITLRDYQEAALKKCFEHKNGLIEAATNAGKTAIFSALLKQMKGMNCLILTHRDELFWQLKEEVEKLTGLTVGTISTKAVDLRPITIAMVPTLLNRIGSDEEITDFFESVKCIIADECHHLKAKGWATLLSSCKAPYRFGFSGTIFDAGSFDGFLVREFVGDVIFKISNATLIDTGVSAKPKVILHPMDSLSLLRTVNGEARNIVGPGVKNADYMRVVYQLVVRNAIVTNHERNAKAVEIVKRDPDKSCLLIVDSLTHGPIIEQMLKDAGVHCVYISGEEDKSDLRLGALMMFKAGKLKVLVSTTILDEGIDVSRIEKLILLAGKKSKRQLLQRVGRGLRRKDGANEVEIHDFLDFGHRYIEAHSKARVTVYRREGFDVTSE